VAAAAAAGVHVLDGGAVTSTSGPDRVHLDGVEHRRLGLAVSDRVLSLLRA
jgi:hypothetical protein